MASSAAVFLLERAGGARHRHGGAIAAALAALRLETNLQRLLRSCEQLSEAPDDGVAQRRRLATYLSVLDRYWHELSAVPAKRQQCPPDELGEYRRRIEQLADLLDDEKLLATASSATATRTHSNSRLSREQANAELSSGCARPTACRRRCAHSC